MTGATMTDCSISDIIAAYREFRGTDCAPETLRVDRKAERALRQMGVNMVSELTMHGAYQHRANRKTEGVCNVTINKEVGAIARMMAWAAACGLCESNPLAGLKPLKERGKPVGRVLKKDEIRSLLSHMLPHRRLLIQVYLCTGMRTREALELRWSELNLESRTIRLPAERTKSRDERPVFLGPRMTALLGGVERQTEYVFPNPKTEKPYSPSQTGRWMKNAAKAAGWADCTSLSPQTLRRSFATIVYNDTKDNVLVHKLLGHAGDLNERCYIRLDDARTREQAAKVEAWILGEEK
jgi:integrase